MPLPSQILFQVQQELEMEDRRGHDISTAYHPRRSRISKSLIPLETFTHSFPGSKSQLTMVINHQEPRILLADPMRLGTVLKHDLPWKEALLKRDLVIRDARAGSKNAIPSHHITSHQPSYILDSSLCCTRFHTRTQSYTSKSPPPKVN